MKHYKGLFMINRQNNREKVLKNTYALNETLHKKDIDEKLLKLPQELLNKANSKEGYDEIADEIFRLRELKQQTSMDTAARDEQLGRITELQDFIRQQSAELTEFDETLVKRWVQKITVWEDRFTVELKSGLSVDVEG